MEKKEKTAFFYCRKKAGVSQLDAAKLLGVTRTTLLGVGNRADSA